MLKLPIKQAEVTFSIRFWVHIKSCCSHFAIARNIGDAFAQSHTHTQKLPSIHTRNGNVSITKTDYFTSVGFPQWTVVFLSHVFIYISLQGRLWGSSFTRQLSLFNCLLPPKRQVLLLACKSCSSCYFAFAGIAFIRQPRVLFQLAKTAKNRVGEEKCFLLV